MLNAATFTTINVATIGITSTSATTKTFAGNGGNYPALIIAGGGTGAVIFTGANTFAQIPQVIGGTKTLTFPASTVTTFAGGHDFSNGSNVVTIQSSTAGTPATLSKPNGRIRADFLSVKDITFTGAGFFAGASSTNTSGNTGVTFTAPTSPDPRPMALIA
jgi:hypothetical protein